MVAAVALVGRLLAGTVYCQQAGPGRGAGGGRGGWDPEQMRQRMAERMREALGATEEEWALLGPRVQKVQDLSGQLNMGGMRMGTRGGPGGRPVRRGAEPQSELQKAVDALRETLADANSTADQIRTGLTAMREAREKVKEQLDVAQKELREVITMRQEAQLVLMGLLD